MTRPKFEITKSRLEAFSDGVIAIIITLMVLEIKRPMFPGVPSAAQLWRTLRGMTPEITAYFMSFLVVGIMWVNHHQMFQMVRRVDHKLLWLNLNFLFWISLIPLPTGILGDNPMMPEASFLYGAVLFMNALSFALLRMHANDCMHEEISHAPKRRAHFKNLTSSALYAMASLMSFVSIYVSFAIFVLVPAMYFVPERISFKRRHMAS